MSENKPTFEWYLQWNRGWDACEKYNKFLSDWDEALQEVITHKEDSVKKRRTTKIHCSPTVNIQQLKEDFELTECKMEEYLSTVRIQGVRKTITYIRIAKNCTKVEFDRMVDLLTTVFCD